MLIAMNTALVDRCRALTPEQLQSHYLVPASWSADTSTALYPIARDYQWQSLIALYSAMNCIGAIAYATPRLWQLDPLIHTVARAHKVADIMIPPATLEQLTPYVSECGVDLVVVGQSDALATLTRINNIQKPPKVLVVVHHVPDTLTRLAAALANRKGDCVVVHELHIVPGVPLLSQQILPDSEELWFMANEAIVDPGSSPATVTLSIANEEPCCSELPFTLRKHSTEELYAYETD